MSRTHSIQTGIPTLGSIVIVKGFKARADGTNEEPGVVNGVTENPTAADMEEIASASKKVSTLTGDASVKEALSRPPEAQVTAEVSPCTVDVALLPKGADLRNIEGVVFFESKDKADEFYDSLPGSVKNVDGAAGCVAYWPEPYRSPEEKKRVEAEKAAKKHAADLASDKTRNEPQHQPVTHPVPPEPHAKPKPRQ